MLIDEILWAASSMDARLNAQRIFQSTCWLLKNLIFEKTFIFRSQKFHLKFFI